MLPSEGPANPPKDSDSRQISGNDTRRNVYHGVILHLDLVQLWHLVEISVQFLLQGRVGDATHRVNSISQALSLETERGGGLEFSDVEEEKVIDVPM